MTNLLILKDVPKRYVDILNKMSGAFNYWWEIGTQIEHALNWRLYSNEFSAVYESDILELLELSLWLHQEIDKVENPFIDDKNISMVLASTPLGENIFYDLYEQHKYKKLIKTLKSHLEKREIISVGQIKRILIQLGEKV